MSFKNLIKPVFANAENVEKLRRENPSLLTNRWVGYLLLSLFVCLNPDEVIKVSTLTIFTIKQYLLRKCKCMRTHFNQLITIQANKK